MAHTFCKGKARNTHRYYRCINAIKNGRDACSAGLLPATEIERVVVDEVRGLAQDETMLKQVLADAEAAVEADLSAVRRERDELRQSIAHGHKELQRLVATGKATANVTGHIADLHSRLAADEQRLPELDSRIAALEKQIVTPDEARAVFADFDGLWQSLIPREQARLLKLLISTVEYDGDASTVSVTFRPTSIRALIDRKLENAA